MDKELLELLNQARASGANAQQLQGIVNSYNQKKKIGIGGTGEKSKSSTTDVLTQPSTEKNSTVVTPTGDIQNTSLFNNNQLDNLGLFTKQQDLPQPAPQEVPAKNFTPDISNHFGFQNPNEVVKENISPSDNINFNSIPILKTKNVLGENVGEISEGQDGRQRHLERQQQ